MQENAAAATKTHPDLYIRHKEHHTKHGMTVRMTAHSLNASKAAVAPQTWRAYILLIVQFQVEQDTIPARSELIAHVLGT